MLMTLNIQFIAAETYAQNNGCFQASVPGVLSLIGDLTKRNENRDHEHMRVAINAYNAAHAGIIADDFTAIFGFAMSFDDTGFGYLELHMDTLLLMFITQFKLIEHREFYKIRKLFLHVANDPSGRRDDWVTAKLVDFKP